MNNNAIDSYLARDGQIERLVIQCQLSTIRVAGMLCSA